MTFKPTKTALATLSAVMLSCGFAGVSHAQQADGGPGMPPQGWFKTCAKQGDNDICQVQNIQLAQNRQMVIAVALITIDGKVKNKLMQVSVPSARLIEPGVGMAIDDGKPQKLDYAVCFPDRCTAEVPLSDALINSLKKGHSVTFTSINFRRVPNPIKISLDGFTGAFDGKPITQNQAEERQRLLEQAMQKKNEEAQKALEDAQKAAKSK
ncbi:invasion associated locus B family protein [Allorhizobium sp. BGMRC 0089]|uniref:invasion associated locus B family protein n=1 Tax=Allorhizobium sonneratiae TaxID=2934936 RepID=UPI0020346543|nr:invasion associated locus B family protein [Allorhizobium sonneratiae]MCM2292958.1 invasion associated locus B family protein [Allorhizobium sonneratiae]